MLYFPVVLARTSFTVCLFVCFRQKTHFVFAVQSEYTAYEHCAHSCVSRPYIFLSSCSCSQAVYQLEHELKCITIACKMRGGNIVFYFFELVAGIFG